MVLSGNNSPKASVVRRVFLGAEGKVRPIWRALLFFAATLLLVAGLGTLWRGLMVRWLGQRDQLLHQHILHAGMAAFYAAAVIGLLWLSWLFLATFDRRSLRTLGLWFYPGWVREALLGVSLGAALITLVVRIIVAADGIILYDAARADAGALLRLAALAGLLLLAAIFEEVLFRGYSFQRLLEAMGPLRAVLLFSALFAIAHLQNPAVTPLSTANTILAGILLSVAYLKTRGLWLPIGLHWGWNFLMGPIFGMGVSGVSFQSPLLASSWTDPQWLSGGLYGPEGSIVLTPMAVAAIIWLWRTRKLTSSPAMQEVLK